MRRAAGVIGRLVDFAHGRAATARPLCELGLNRKSMPRFILKNETVLDARTGLMWPRDASLFDLPMRWAEALDAVRQLNDAGWGGYRDWKLPNRRELFSLLSHETINPSLPPGHPFSGLFHGYYWTSSTCARLPDQAWYIHLGGARVFKGMKHGSYMVWPVRVADQNGTSPVLQTGQRNCFDEHGARVECRRTGQDGEFRSGLPGDKKRFVEKAHVVLDQVTGLSWLKNANIAQTTMDWPATADFVARMNAEGRFGRDDWRLPDIVELESLTDMGRHSPALPAGHPFVDAAAFYWSSTTSRYDPRYAWVLYLVDGAIGVGHKPLPEFYVWPVAG
jgi:hypothetical protein